MARAGGRLGACLRAGAEVVLADLTEFPSWLERYVAGGADGGDGAAT
ncbi:hypothetical protein [Streptomyces auratus]